MQTSNSQKMKIFLKNESGPETSEHQGASKQLKVVDSTSGIGSLEDIRIPVVIINSYNNGFDPNNGMMPSNLLLINSRYFVFFHFLTIFPYGILYTLFLHDKNSPKCVKKGVFCV